MYIFDGIFNAIPGPAACVQDKEKEIKNEEKG